jgi:hypothetical protein
MCEVPLLRSAVNLMAKLYLKTHSGLILKRLRWVILKLLEIKIK